MNQKLHNAFLAGDAQKILELVTDPALASDFETYGGTPILEYAIYWSPLQTIHDLILAGVTVNYGANNGFPCLIALISNQDRTDRHAVLRLLLQHGANIHERGFNDGTPLHHAVWHRDAEAIKILLAHGADPTLRTRIDDLSTPLEDAKAMGFAEGAARLR